MRARLGGGRSLACWPGTSGHDYRCFVRRMARLPRGEDPGQIVNEIEPGVRESGLDAVDADSPYTNRGYQIIVDRKKAIRSAVDLADKGDIVLIAGKGHENYQIVGKRKRYFNDAEEAAQAAS